MPKRLNPWTVIRPPLKATDSGFLHIGRADAQVMFPRGPTGHAVPRPRGPAAHAMRKMASDAAKGA